MSELKDKFKNVINNLKDSSILAANLFSPNTFNVANALISKFGNKNNEISGKGNSFLDTGTGIVFDNYGDAFGFGNNINGEELAIAGNNIGFAKKIEFSDVNIMMNTTNSNQSNGTATQPTSGQVGEQGQLQNQNRQPTENQQPQAQEPVNNDIRYAAPLPPKPKKKVGIIGLIGVACFAYVAGENIVGHSDDRKAHLYNDYQCLNIEANSPLLKDVIKKTKGSLNERDLCLMGAWNAALKEAQKKASTLKISGIKLSNLDLDQHFKMREKQFNNEHAYKISMKYRHIQSELAPIDSTNMSHYIKYEVKKALKP